jgi:hypothetical protein
LPSGILMSKEGKLGVILTKEGTFESVRLPKDQKVSVGEEIHVDPPLTFKIPKSALSALAACLLLFAGLGAFGLGNLNKAVAAYVSFDINPSFEAGLNRELHVVSVHPMNTDGSKIIHQVKDYKNLSLDEFTKKVAKALDEDGYFKQQPHLVVSVTLTKNLPEKSAKPLETEISKALEPIDQTQNFKYNQGVLQVINTSMETHEQAEKLGFTAGKYTLYKSAAKKSNAVTPDKAKGMTVRELIKVAHPEVPSPKSPKGVLTPPNSNKSNGRKGSVPKPLHSHPKKQEHLIKKVIPHKTGTTKIPVNPPKDKQLKKTVQNVEKQEEQGYRGNNYKRREWHSGQVKHGLQKKQEKKKEWSDYKGTFAFQLNTKWN